MLTSVIVSKSLDNLRNEEESEVHWVLSHDSIGVLQQDRITIVAPFEEGVGHDRRNWCPEQEILDVVG